MCWILGPFFDTIDNSIVMKGEKEEMVGERKKEYHFTASDMPFIMVKECYCPPTWQNIWKIAKMSFKPSYGPNSQHIIYHIVTEA